jgi:NAD(P)-dependent dehydrogenase (short-subunit alcohol dehydrogenase family)
VEGLQNKVVIVAGAALGIGAATARKLAKCGAKVVVADINENGAGATAESIRAAGGSAIPFWFDITDEQSIARMIAHVVDKYGQLDGLHNNVADVALTARDTNLLDVDLGVWERMLHVNLTGTFLTMRHAVRQMLKQGAGAIVNTSSAAAFSALPSVPAYASSKAGINALTRHVASAYGRQGIRCNAVAPGIIATEGAVAAARQSDAERERWYRHVRENVAHSHRDGKPEDIAAVVALMLSDEGSWINGQCFSVDGGWLFR